MVEGGCGQSQGLACGKADTGPKEATLSPKGGKIPNFSGRWIGFLVLMQKKEKKMKKKKPRCLQIKSWFSSNTQHSALPLVDIGPFAL